LPEPEVAARKPRADLLRIRDANGALMLQVARIAAEVARRMGRSGQTNA
jgi:hypothetical protein